MNFEFDPAKSAFNNDKHGIDFEQAQALWADEQLLVVPARAEDEPRWLAIGQCAGRHWAAVFTLRTSNVRLISVRRARESEIERYEDARV